MRILIDVNHPAHVHFFKYFIWEMQKRNHQILITASAKDITFELLKKYNLDFIDLGEYGKSMLKKLVNIPIKDLKLLRSIKAFKPDVLMGIASFRASHVGFLTGRKSFVFDDTEHSTKEILLYKPFATKIFTPDCFLTDINQKQIRYKGYHELAYLHPNYFKPEFSILNELKIKEGEPFFIIRFVSWGAMHDIGQMGLSEDGKDRLINKLLEYGKVIITSEETLPEKYEQYRMNLSSAMIHQLLYFATMYIGEGGTMASEAAVLGTPSIFINSLDAGTFKDLEENYKLMRRFSNESEAMVFIEDQLQNPNLKQDWRKKQEHLLDSKIDVTKWLVNYCEENV